MKYFGGSDLLNGRIDYQRFLGPKSTRPHGDAVGLEIFVQELLKLIDLIVTP